MFMPVWELCFWMAIAAFAGAVVAAVWVKHYTRQEIWAQVDECYVHKATLVRQESDQ